MNAKRIKIADRNSSEFPNSSKGGEARGHAAIINSLPPQQFPGKL